MVGATATVSTLVTVDGQPYRPTFAGKGGLSLGFPCLPSRLSISAVSSPAEDTQVSETIHLSRQDLMSTSEILWRCIGNRLNAFLQQEQILDGFTFVFSDRNLRTL